MGNPLPGTVVPTSSLVTPGGPQGPSGASAAIVTYGASGLAPGFNQRLQLRSDFTEPLNGNVTANTYASYGSIPWYVNQTGGGNGGGIGNTSNGIDIFNKAYGVWYLNSGGTNAQYTVITPPIQLFASGLGALDIYFRIAFGRINTSGNLFNNFIGISDGTGTYQNSVFLWMRWDSGVSNNTWVGYCAKANVSSTTAGSQTPAIVAFSSSALTYYNCQISINAAWTSVSFYVNNVLIGTLTTNIPAAGTLMFPWIFVQMGSLGASQASLYVDDYFLDYQYALP